MRRQTDHRGVRIPGACSVEWINPVSEGNGLAVLVDAIDQVDGCNDLAALLDLLLANAGQWARELDPKEFEALQFHVAEKRRKVKKW